MNIYEEHLLPMIKTTCLALENTPQMQEILHGEMPMERFRWQIRQNYQYLLEYTKCWAIGFSKAQGFDEMQQWFSIVKSTFEDTVAMNRTYWAEQIGATTDELESTIMAQGKRSYTAHELARAFEGDLATCLMGLFPCNVLYMHMGNDLLPQCTLEKDNMFYKWIEFYTLPAYRAKCEREIEMINRLCENKNERELRRLLEIFAVGCNYELLQWRDMYYKMETWPLEEIFPK
jgi:thiaminase/transcriptional activator TenA